MTYKIMFPELTRLSHNRYSICEFQVKQERCYQIPDQAFKNSQRWVNNQIPDQVWDDAPRLESGEREEVFAMQKPPPSPENISSVILDLIQDLFELCSCCFNSCWIWDLIINQLLSVILDL